VAEIPSPAGLDVPARTDWLRGAFQGEWSQIPGEIDYVRWAAGVAEAVAELEGAAVFSHFVAINAAVAAARRDARVSQFEPGHASITVFRIGASGGLDLVAEGESAVTQVL
jgi:hypothetical protein